jgi:glycosyltransferase involved in cell wall biosynthesis
MKKVCFISIKAYPLFNREYSAVYGGAEVQMYQLAKKMAEDESFKVSFVVGDLGQPEEELFGNVRVVKSMKLERRFGLLSGILEQLKIWLVLKKSDADVYIQRASGVQTFIMAFFCRLHGKKFIYMVANLPDVDGSFRKNNCFIGWLYETGLKMADVVIAQNKDQQEFLKENFKKESVLVKNSFYLEKRRETARTKILWIASSRSQKQPEIFLKLAEEFPKEKFVMIMPKNDMDLWNKIYSKTKLIDNLEFIEKVPFDRISRYFTRAKIFVNTSSYEGFPNTFIQATIFGVPILSLSVNPDNFINEYGCGYFSRGNFEKMKVQTEKLIKNEELRENFSKNALSYVKKEHDIERNIEKIKKIINYL